MSRKNSIIQRIWCNVYMCMCILNKQHVNETAACLQYSYRPICKFATEQLNRKKYKDVEV